MARAKGRKSPVYAARMAKAPPKKTGASGRKPTPRAVSTGVAARTKAGAARARAGAKAAVSKVRQATEVVKAVVTGQARTRGGGPAKKAQQPSTGKGARRRQEAATTRKAEPARKPASTPTAKGAKPRRAAKTAAKRLRADVEYDNLAEKQAGGTPPSSLDFDERPSAARSGGKRMAARLKEQAGSGGLTAGDVDADWAMAASVGDEVPGGDNPTPDQDAVDNVGRAMGVQYEDNEELKAVDKIAERDRKRWELDPASSEDYAERNRR
jgi:hypothetical protein